MDSAIELRGGHAAGGMGRRESEGVGVIPAVVDNAPAGEPPQAGAGEGCDGHSDFLPALTVAKGDGRLVPLIKTKQRQPMTGGMIKHGGIAGHIGHGAGALERQDEEFL